MSIMRSRRFDAHIAAGPGGRGVIEVPFDPRRGLECQSQAPGQRHDQRPVVRGTIARGGSGWALAVTPMWLRDTGVAAGDDVIVELGPEGPQRSDLAPDISAALEASPAAAAFFDTLAQFYRKAYLRWIDATARRPDLRAARIARGRPARGRDQPTATKVDSGPVESTADRRIGRQGCCLVNCVRPAQSRLIWMRVRRGPGIGQGWINLAARDNRTRRSAPPVAVEHVMRHGSRR
jgi:hypothetical protein